MISNDERREIAARLREQSVWDIFTNFENCIGDLCDAVFDDEGDLNDMFRLQKALADLIDLPTAKREHNGAYWRCANCGAFTRKDAVIIDGLDVVPLRHCGNCGMELDYD